MGGYGSGRWGSHTKATTVEECLVLPTTYLRNALSAVADGRAGFGMGTLQWSIRGEVKSRIGATVIREGDAPAVRLQYTTTRPGGDATDSNYTVGAVSTSPTYGGRRWWWLCPLNHRARGACNRRVGKLYLPSGASYFGCRHCYELSYTSAQEHDSRVSRLANDPMALYAAMRGAIDDAGDDTMRSIPNLLIALKAAHQLERRHGLKT